VGPHGEVLLAGEQGGEDCWTRGVTITSTALGSFTWAALFCGGVKTCTEVAEAP
jgi:hypothetical protein